MQPPADSARSIRSYVIRAGRMTPAQRRALDELWPRYGVEFAPEVLQLEQLFARSAPCTLEIGFGNGDHLLERALAEPHINFLGVEVHPPGVGHLLMSVARAGISNLRIIAHDAVMVLQQQIGADSLNEVQLLFPDPWPKARHHKRRIVQPEFVACVAARLRPGGHFHLATDWEPYADDMLTVLRGCEGLENASPVGGFIEQTAARTATRFERRGARLGHRVRELLFVRR
jgi:tRNA (guanine-N7-)-methyltransferase